jgi:hypothetical protein
MVRKKGKEEIAPCYALPFLKMNRLNDAGDFRTDFDLLQRLQAADTIDHFREILLLYRGRFHRHALRRLRCGVFAAGFII